MRAAVLACAALAPACVPSHSTLFGPVDQAVRERTGVTAEWRTAWSPSADADRRIRELLAEPLTADHAAEIAILGSPELQAAYAELGVAAGDIATARTPPNPEVEAEVRFPLDGGERQIELTAVQSVTGLIAILPRAGAADAEVKAVRRRTVTRTLQVAGAARIAFYQAASAEHSLSLRRTIAEAAAASGELARSLHRAGNITDLDLTREAVFEEEAQLSLRDAESRATSAREHLNAVLGLHGDATRWRIAARLPDAPSGAPAVDDLEREAIVASLDLDAQRLALRAAGQRIGVARLESFLPDLGLGVTAKREAGWGVGPVLTLAVPLFDWGQGERASAWAELRRVQHEYTALAIRIRAQARAARARLVAAQRRASRMKSQVLPLRERLVDESLRQYNAMNLTAFELLTVRREHIEAEERYVEALRDYWIAAAEVAQLRAGSLPEERTGP